MPMTGMRSDEHRRAATARGTHSTTSNAAPAASIACASLNNAALDASSLPCTR
jgi:hypothetical protein